MAAENAMTGVASASGERPKRRPAFQVCGTSDGYGDRDEKAADKTAGLRLLFSRRDDLASRYGQLLESCLSDRPIAPYNAGMRYQDIITIEPGFAASVRR